MAINLNPGADATLVNAAYKAAVSTAPKDYSRTLERAADSYEKTMQAQSQTLGSIAALGTAIGSEMVANANELSAMAAEGAGLDAEGAKVLIEELYANKDAQKELRGINFLQSRETRQKKQALKLEQRELFANIKNATESIRVGSEAVAAGTFKVLTGNEAEADMVNAIIKSNLKDKVTNNKNIARLGRDEKTGELMYTMYDTESDPNGVSYDPPQTMTIRQFNKAITTNVDDKGVMKGKLNTVNDASAKAGNTSLNGTYHSEMKQMHLNQLDDIVKTDTDLQRAFGEKFGYSNSSFLEDIIKPSTLSLELYNTLLETTGGGDVLTGGITDNMIDTDGEAGISQAELQNNTNYGILSANILGMKDPKVSKALFKEYTIDKFEAAHKVGYGQKPPVAGSGTDGTKTDINPYGLPDKIRLGPIPYEGGYAQEETRAQVTRWIDSLNNGTKIQYQGNEYTFRDNNWVENYGIKKGDEDLTKIIGNADDMRDDIFITDHPGFNNITTKAEAEKIDHGKGKTASQNPFGDGAGEIARLPSDFTKAVDKDDLKVKEYLDNMKITGLEVKASGFGSDSVTLKLGGKSKTFIVDTNFTDDEDRASEIWKWLHSNWSVGKSSYSGSAADIVAGVES